MIHFHSTLDCVLCFCSFIAGHLVGRRVTYTSLLGAHAKVGDADQIGSVLHRMQRASSERNKVTYTSLLSAHAKVGDADQAERVLKSMQRAIIQPNKVAAPCCAPACKEKETAVLRAFWMQICRLRSTPSVSNLWHLQCSL